MYCNTVYDDEGLYEEDWLDTGIYGFCATRYHGLPMRGTPIFERLRLYVKHPGTYVEYIYLNINININIYIYIRETLRITRAGT